MEESKCRACLTYVGNNPLSLYEDYKTSTVYYYLNLLANIDIKEGDGFPTFICKSCFLKLENAVIFIDECQQSDAILRSGKLKLSLEILETVSVKKEDEINDNDDVDTESFVYEYCHKDEVKTEDVSNKNLQVECHDCGNQFKTKCKLRVHWKKVHLPEILVCPNCKRKFNKFSSLKKHKKVRPLSCLSAEYVRIEGQGRSRVFYCKHCDYKTCKVNASVAHTYVHSGIKKFQCNHCPKSFSQSGGLLSHKEVVHKEFRKQITCQYCGKEVKGRDNVYRHLKSHTDNHHKCEVCNKVLSTKKSLILHMKRHEGVKEVTCHICAWNFFTLSELITHVRKRHGGKKPVCFTCDLCNYKTKEKYVLKKHLARHSRSNFACGICNSFFDDEEQVKKHINNHINKKFKCHICDARYAFKKSVWKHIRNKHNKITSVTKPGVCIKKEKIEKSNDKGLVEIEILPTKTY